MEAGLDRASLDVGDGRVVERAAGSLERGLERLEDVDDERAGPRLELQLGGRQREIHRPSMTGR